VIRVSVGVKAASVALLARDLVGDVQQNSRRKLAADRLGLSPTHADA
jgi:hypothetical protein